MNVTRFLARDAADAVGQIRSELGPSAVVLSVTQSPTSGLSRLWRKPQLEVLVGVPEPGDGAPTPLPQKTSEAGEWNGNAPPPGGQHLNQLDSDGSDFLKPNGTPPSAGTDPALVKGLWRSGAVLVQMGLQPLHMEKVIERAQSQYGDLPPPSLAQELGIIRAALASFWRPLASTKGSAPTMHVFVGPPGSGKTTALCKWLTKSILTDGGTARAWRLDGRGANIAGLLDFYGEILDVPVEREWNVGQALTGFDTGFVDLPGVNAHDVTGLQELAARLGAIPNAQVHLVLNAAYDVTVTLAQARAFAALPVSDVIFTHTDEEKRRIKLWNFVLGTNFTLRFLSGGQNIPGDFLVAAPELLIPRLAGA